MATTTPNAPKPAHPFAGMTRLSPQIWIHEPSSPPDTSISTTKNNNTTTTTTAPPRLILFASWMGARDIHIAKYIAQYTKLYPRAAILIVKFETAQLWAGAAAGRKAVSAAVTYLQSKVASGQLSTTTTTTTNPEVLIHLFSNGGATTMQNIYLAWHHHHHHHHSPSSNTTTPPSTATNPFPSSVAIYDSAPGLPTLLRTYRAFSISFLPQNNPLLRAILAPLLAAMCVLSWVYMHVLLRRVLVPLGLARSDILSRNFVVLNDTTAAGAGGTIGCQTLRTYIYSKEDAMIDWRHVEKHAADAATGGRSGSGSGSGSGNNNASPSPTTRVKIPCRLEMFHGSGHVAHMRHDPERYWRVVRETWEQGSQ